MARRVMIEGRLGCAEPLANGTDGQVLTLVAGAPAWADATGGGGTSNFDPCAMTPAEVTCLMAGLDLSQLSPAQVVALGQLLRGDLVEDAFGVDLGYLLPL